MGLGNWVKQVTRNESGAAHSRSDPSPDQTSASRLEIDDASSLAGPVATPTCPAPADRWIGYVDRVTPTSIEGWACDTQNAGTHVTVEALISNGKRILAVAHLFRRDVEEAGYGDGTCGFFLDLSKLPLQDESAIVRFADSKHPISVEPIEFNAARAVLTMDMPKGFCGLMELCAAEARQAVETLGALE